MMLLSDRLEQVNIIAINLALSGNKNIDFYLKQIRDIQKRMDRGEIWENIK